MKTAYVVLGMHRSGTSSMAGVLALMGATPPKTLMGPAADNPKGFWESYAVSDLNDRILAVGGSIWSDWRDFPAALSEAFLSEGLDVLASEFADADRLVLKDPRICRLYPFWRRVLTGAGYRPVVISPLRHPAEVAASLHSRNGMALNDAYRLWLRHVLQAEYESRGDARKIVLWTDLLTDWRSTLARIAQATDAHLDFNDPKIQVEIDAFLTLDLRHHRNQDQTTPSACAEAFEALSALGRHNEPGDATVTLDRLRNDLNQAS